MRKVLRLRPDEFVVATLVALTVVCVGVEQGIVLAIVASIIDHLRRSYRPGTHRCCSPERMAAGTASPSEPGLPERCRGSSSTASPGSLYYANANLFLEQTSAFASRGRPADMDLRRCSRHARHRLQRR